MTERIQPGMTVRHTFYPASLGEVVEVTERDAKVRWQPRNMATWVAKSALDTIDGELTAESKP